MLSSKRNQMYVYSNIIYKNTILLLRERGRRERRREGERESEREGRERERERDA